MDSPLISVILATYNGSLYLSEAINSVLNQDYKNLELIIINDASTDLAVNRIIENSISQDTRVIFYRNEQNMERSWSKNFAISKAQGNFIAFIDDDDIWEKEKLGEQIRVMQENNNIGIIGTFASFINENGKILSETNHLKCTSEEIIKNILLLNQFIQSSVLIKKEVFLRAGGFPDFDLCEDYDLWFRILKISQGINIGKFLVQYRVRESSTTAKNIYRMKWITIKLVWKYRKQFPGFLKSFLFRLGLFPFNTIFLMKMRDLFFGK